MKRLLIAAVMAATTVTSAQAGLFDSAMTSGWEKKSTDKYKLEVYGWDVRAYEWTPKENPNWRCVFLAGNENSSGSACYPVAPRKGGDA